ncbi:hypothetical protein BH11BAC5_BH11BAC5_12120 [soil metagenome]
MIIMINLNTLQSQGVFYLNFSAPINNKII